MLVPPLGYTSPPHSIRRATVSLDCFANSREQAAAITMIALTAWHDAATPHGTSNCRDKMVVQPSGTQPQWRSTPANFRPAATADKQLIPQLFTLERKS